MITAILEQVLCKAVKSFVNFVSTKEQNFAQHVADAFMVHLKFNIYIFTV